MEHCGTFQKNTVEHDGNSWNTAEHDGTLRNIPEEGHKNTMEVHKREEEHGRKLWNFLEKIP